jgi:hypothetical protein
MAVVNGDDVLVCILAKDKEDFPVIIPKKIMGNTAGIQW